MTNFDECLAKPCHVNAVCQNLVGRYKCTCKIGFSGDGETCQGIVAALHDKLSRRILLGLIQVLDHILPRPKSCCVVIPRYNNIIFLYSENVSSKLKTFIVILNLKNC